MSHDHWTDLAQELLLDNLSPEEAADALIGEGCHAHLADEIVEEVYQELVDGGLL